ncbi:MAG: hypothetical protein AB7K37_11640 [Cyclobacteriaceae bacterium]
MTYHVLNGDALAARFPHERLSGEVIVMREALIDGDVNAATEELFFEARASHHQTRVDHYRQHVVSEWNRLASTGDGSEIFLWFGYDLFCQVNLWYLLHRLSDIHTRALYIVYPSYLPVARRWDDFGYASADDLVACYRHAIRLAPGDIELAMRLWKAYRENDRPLLKLLSNRQSASFPYLREVCEAQLDRAPDSASEGRPQRIVRQIMNEGILSFEDAFREFHKRAGVYGFGDVQFRTIFEQSL